jgi:ABC-2 type transport system permease protein
MRSGSREWRFELRADRITATGRGGSGQISILIALSIAFLLYMTIFIYGQNVLRGVMEEKQTRVAEIVISEACDPPRCLPERCLA